MKRITEAGDAILLVVSVSVSGGSWGKRKKAGGEEERESLAVTAFPMAILLPVSAGARARVWSHSILVRLEVWMILLVLDHDNNPKIEYLSL